MLVESMLDAVDRWATGYWMLRETGIPFPHAGRIDALLIPCSYEAGCMKKNTKDWFFDRVRLLGVEVKRTREDFNRGLRTGQYEKYDEFLSGLYVATPKGLIKSGELPDGVGHLVCRWSPRDRTRRKRWYFNPEGVSQICRCTCRKAPMIKDKLPEHYVAWRLMFELYRQHSDEIARIRCRTNEALQTLGHVVGHTVMPCLREGVDQIIEQIDQKRREETEVTA